VAGDQRGRPDPDDFLEMPAAAYAAPLLDESTTGSSTSASSASGSTVSHDVATLRSALAGRYRIERELGRGGMATVYLAHDERHVRRVAIKVLHHDLAQSLGAERFAREIETVAGMAHPHILPLHDSGAAAGLVYFVMPFVDGESLRDRLAREPQLSVPAAVRIATEVADALAYAHRRGVVHRDIKPGNILLTSSANSGPGGGSTHALLADFGVARALASDGGASGNASGPLTATGLAVGTPAYMSPEQAAGERETDGRSDVYSLGCVLYEMLAGQVPFAGPSAQAVITKRLTEQPPSVNRARPDVSAALDAVVTRALATDPAGRYQTADDLLDALTHASTDQRPLAASRARRRTPLIIAGVAAVALGVIGGALWRGRPAIASSASAIVILPPTPVTADTALARLGRELAITLSANLDGVGGIRVADALSVLANVPGSDQPPTLEQARALARRLGGTSVMRGTLIRAGDSVRVDVTLHPATCPAADCAQPVATALVSARADDITALTDQTTWAILRGVWQRDGTPSPSLAAVTTKSIPALRAFLDGERAVVDGRWRAAPAAYERAFTADTTFLLAYWRYAFARSYWSLPVDSAIRARYRTHRSQFPPRDSLLIEADLVDSLSVRYEHLKSAAERNPDYWPAWWMLSDMLAHHGPLVGTTSREARTALERTIALNPRMSSAWTHLLWVALRERDTLLIDRTLGKLAELRYDTVSRTEQGYDELAYFRYVGAVARAGGVPPDTMLRDPGLRLFVSMPGDIDPLTLGLGSSQYGLAREQVAFSSRVLALNPAARVGAGHQLAIAIAQAQRGAWGSSLEAIDRYVARAADPAAPLYAYRLAVVGAWLGALPPDAAGSRRSGVLRDSAGLTPAARAELAWLDGIFAVATRDSTSLDVARGALRGSPAGQAPIAPMLERSLTAFRLMLGGDGERATDSLVALERDRAERGSSRFANDAHPFLTVVNRLAAGRWLREHGRPGDAARILTWHEAMVVSLRASRQANAIAEGLAYLERAHAAESLGQGDLARDYYLRFLRYYDAPEAAHRHLIDDANQALVRLRGGEPGRVPDE
jgi:serine/threonine-protein kinase